MLSGSRWRVISKKAISNPGSILPYLSRVISDFTIYLKKRQVKVCNIEGAVFYKYKGELYPERLNQGNACAFILEKAEEYCCGRGVDIGASKWPLPGATPILDSQHQNAYKLDDFADGSLDYIFSSHCLEHLTRWKDALRLWITKLKPGGILFLYLPHKSMKLWRPGAPWVEHDHKWIPQAKIINNFLKKNSMKVVEYNPGKDDYWSFYVVAKKVKGAA